MASFSSVATKLDAVPFDQIADNVHEITERLAGLSKSPQLTENSTAARRYSGECRPDNARSAYAVGPLIASLHRLANQADSTVAAARDVISSSPLRASQPETEGLGNTLYKLTRAALACANSRITLIAILKPCCTGGVGAIDALGCSSVGGRLSCLR